MTTPNSKQGRWIRAALVILPVGTIILGAASFGIWWWNKQRVQERSYKFATAMRRDVSAGAVDRYVGILKDVLNQPQARKLGAVAAFLESSMGAENMGYDVRRDHFPMDGIEVANVDAELTGKRWREVVLVLAPYGEPGKVDAESHALATLMSLAHALTGENRELTLRFAGVPLGVKDPEGRTALERFAASARGREERVMRTWVLGGPDEALLAEVRAAFQSEAQGTVVEGLPATTDTAATLATATALKPVLVRAIER
jgi:hypothetical protein